MIIRLFKVLTLATYCCINITYAVDENSSPDNSPVKKASLGEQRRPVSNLKPEQRKVFKEAGFTELRLILINVAQTALYRGARGSALKESSYFDDKELNKYYCELSNFSDPNPTETLRQLIFNLKTLYPEPIPLSTLSMNPTTIHTPCVRLAFDNDRQARDACEAIADKTLLQHVNGLTYKEPDEEKETSEMRRARKNLQARIFKKIEAERGITYERLVAETNQTYKNWKEYLHYFELRKEAIEKGLEVKITACEIEDVFYELVRPFYSVIKVNGWSLYFNENEIDLQRSNEDGLSNFDLLMQNDSPIGADGQPMNLHHLTRRQPGIIILLPGSFHTKNTGLLHLRSEQHMRQLEAINRYYFNWWKKIALKALGEYLSLTAAPVVRSGVRIRREAANISYAAQPAIAKRKKASNVTGHIRPREAAQKESPVRMQVVTQLFED